MNANPVGILAWATLVVAAVLVTPWFLIGAGALVAWSAWPEKRR